MASPLELASYVQGQFNQGRERRDRNRLASLAGEAYAADPSQQRALVGQAIATNPDAGFALGQNLGKDRNARVQQLSQMARMLVSYKESGNDAGVQGLYPRIAQEAQAVGLGQGIPQQWDDTFLPGMQQLANIGGAAAGNTVQSRFVADDGRVMMVMRDGTVTDSGQKADRQMWFRDHPGMEPQLVGKDGSVMPVGQPAGNQLQTTQAVVPSRYSPPAQGQHPNVEQVLAQANAAVRSGVPQEQVEAWIQQQLSQAPQAAMPRAQSMGQMPAAMPASAPAGGALPPRLDYTGGGLARPSEAQTAAQVEAAKQQAQLAYLPQQLAIQGQAAVDQKAGEAAVGIRAEQAELDATRSRDAASALDLLDEAERILPRATGGVVGTARDAVLGAFNVSTEGADATAQLQTIAGQLTSRMPRMQGPQSDRDVQLYKEMAGDLANPMLPVARRQAALEQIRRLNTKYADRNREAPSGGSDIDAILNKYGIR